MLSSAINVGIESCTKKEERIKMSQSNMKQYDFDTINSFLLSLSCVACVHDLKINQFIISPKYKRNHFNNFAKLIHSISVTSIL